MKYRKKPIIVEAEQWFPGKEVKGVSRDLINGNIHTTCITIHGQVTHVSPGDWIITEQDGIHHYPCKPDIFESTYELI
jgi:hypothetical protein